MAMLKLNIKWNAAKNAKEQLTQKLSMCRNDIY